MTLSTCVVEVRWLPAADPREAALLDRLHEARQDRRVARAPHEPGPDDDGLEAVAVGVADDLLGLRLGGRVQGLRVGAQGSVLVHVHERLAGHQPRLGADVHEAAHAGGATRLDRVARALHVGALELLARAPLTEVRRGVEGDVRALGAGPHRLGVVEVAAHRLGAGRARPSPPRRRSAPARAPASRRRPGAGSGGRR